MTDDLLVMAIVCLVWGTVRLASTLLAWADEIERRSMSDE